MLKTFALDQQGGKGADDLTFEVSPTILSDSHGTPQAVCCFARKKKRSISRAKSCICFSSPQDHCVTRGYMEECTPTLNAAAGMSGNNRPFIVRGKKTNVISTFGVGEVDDPSPTL